MKLALANNETSFPDFGSLTFEEYGLISDIPLIPFSSMRLPWTVFRIDTTISETTKELQIAHHEEIKDLKTPPKSWADLLKKKDNSSQNSVLPKSSELLPVPGSSNTTPPSAFSDVLENFAISFEKPTIVARGLNNDRNTCYMNAVLQSILRCSPLYHLLIQIKKKVPHSFKNSTPLTTALITLIQEYCDDARSEDTLASFTPTSVYEALQSLKKFDSSKGRQEDAEEFLSFLLDQLHEEFLSEMKTNHNHISVSNNGEWLEVGKKHKTALTKTVYVQPSPISKIFGGNLKSVLHSPGAKESVTIEPFHTLQLDISPESVCGIQDALERLSLSETVEWIDKSNNSKVQATKTTYIDELPPFLILHLKRFVYSRGETKKIHKQIGIPEELEIPLASLSPIARQNHRYKLLSVIYHHGQQAGGGHYTCDVQEGGKWLRIDDTNISEVSFDEITNSDSKTSPYESRHPYLLLYEAKISVV